jgi:hypothetical protein
MQDKEKFWLFNGYLKYELENKCPLLAKNVNTTIQLSHMSFTTYVIWV